jgi:hypothetical protein
VAGNAGAYAGGIVERPSGDLPGQEASVSPCCRGVLSSPPPAGTQRGPAGGAWQATPITPSIHPAGGDPGGS